MRHFWFYCKPSATLHGERKGVSREHHSLHLSSTELSVWTGRRPMDPTQVPIEDALLCSTTFPLLSCLISMNNCTTCSLLPSPTPAAEGRSVLVT